MKKEDKTMIIKNHQSFTKFLYGTVIALTALSKSRLAASTSKDIRSKVVNSVIFRKRINIIFK
jgi:hypothetical protein